MLGNPVMAAEPEGLQGQLIKTDEEASDGNISFDEKK